MARDDLFRRSFEAGAAFLDMTRERAEALVKELVKAGDVQKGKAQKVIDELLERSRKGTEELRQLVRREIVEQVAALGLATKEDLARVEGRLDGMAAAATGAPTGAAVPTGAAAPTGVAKAEKADKAEKVAKKAAKKLAAPTSKKAAKKAAKKATATSPPGPETAGPDAATAAGGPPSQG